MNLIRVARIAIAGIVLASGCASSKNEDEQSGISGSLEMARQFVSSGEYRKAIMALQEARAKAPDDHRIEGFLGLAYMGLGDHGAAARAFERAIELNGEDLDSRLNLAFALTARGKNAEARKHLDVVLSARHYSSPEKAQNNYGLTYLQEKRCDLAEKHFNEALQRDPTFVSAHFNIGRCEMMQKNYTKAIESFKKASDFCPECPDPAIEMARAQYLSGKRKAAVAQLESVLAGKPDRATEERTRRMLQEFRR